MLIIIPGYMDRVMVEEQALRGQIGEPYAEYMARSYRLIPRIW
jgi:protein-S-isoprenylcysteine O-methyltransferase Ste14